MASSITRKFKKVFYLLLIGFLISFSHLPLAFGQSDRSADIIFVIDSVRRQMNLYQELYLARDTIGL